MNRPLELLFKQARRDPQDRYVDPQQNYRSKKISFPILTPCDAEKESHPEADDMRNVTYLRVIAGDQSRIIDYGHVVKKVDDRYQALGRQEKPGELSGLTSMTQAATLKIAADAPTIPRWGA